MSGNNVKLSLKLIIDTKAKKVVFAEAGKDFVDFVFHILSLPLATVAKLLNNKGMNGCLGTVYKSFYALESQYFQPGIERHTVFNPNIDVIVPLLSFNVTQSTDIYKCPSHNIVTFKYKLPCPQYGCSKYMDHSSVFVRDSTQGFVNAATVYMVKDDLEVKPMSISLIRNHVSDFDYLQEEVVEFGVEKALEIVKASLETNAVLTTVFLGEKDTSHSGVSKVE